MISLWKIELCELPPEMDREEMDVYILLFERELKNTNRVADGERFRAIEKRLGEIYRIYMFRFSRKNIRIPVLKTRVWKRISSR